MAHTWLQGELNKDDDVLTIHQHSDYCGPQVFIVSCKHSKAFFQRATLGREWCGIKRGWAFDLADPVRTIVDRSVHIVRTYISSLALADMLIPLRHIRNLNIKARNMSHSGRKCDGRLRRLQVPGRRLRTIDSQIAIRMRREARRGGQGSARLRKGANLTKHKVRGQACVISLFILQYGGGSAQL